MENQQPKRSSQKERQVRMTAKDVVWLMQVGLGRNAMQWRRRQQVKTKTSQQEQGE